MTQQTVQLVPEDQARGRWRFERTISIPTMLMVCGALLSMITYAQDIKADAKKANEKADRTEAQQVMQNQTYAQQIAVLRGELTATRNEMRDDIAKVNDKLDRLIFTLGVDNPKTSRWTK